MKISKNKIKGKINNLWEIENFSFDEIEVMYKNKINIPPTKIKNNT